jgi:iron complex outermembrane receptor protein
MDRLHKFMVSSSALAIAAIGLNSSPSFAQDIGAQPSVEAVTVTGSRISIAGYEAPSPVTVIDSAQLQRDAKLNIVDSIVQLPAVGPSETPNNGTLSGDFSQGDASLSVVNLRNLGVDRTLVLFDGQRVVSSNLFGGGVDLSTIPADLVKRVDVVTGGASAAYGSDAVAGVVNLILDKEFTGWKAEVEGGDTTVMQHRQLKAALTWGTDFDSGRGHLILSGDHTWSPDPVFLREADWYNNAQIVQNTAATSTNGLPYYVHVRNAGSALNAQGGLVTGNTTAGVGGSATANSLAGTQFLTGGAPSQFNFGTVNAANPIFCYAGCSGTPQNYAAGEALLAVPYHASTFFGYGSYQVTPDIKASLQLNYGLFAEENTGGNRTSSVAITADNAFLPQSVAAQFGVLSNGYNTATGLGGSSARPSQTLTVNTNNTNNIDWSKPITMGEVCTTVGVPCLHLNRALTRGVFTLEGTLGNDWSWNAYAQHSQVREHQVAQQDSFGTRYNNAIDAVKVTPTNVGSSGLPIGTIQCRALLSASTAAAANGCVPLDIIGTGVASAAAITYVNPGTDPNSGILNQELIILNQDVFSGSMQGELPWSLPAGKVAVAFGGEYRHEGAAIPYADPNGLTGQYAAGNFRAYSGQYSVEEGFVETDVPVLKDQYVESLNLNMAGRVTNYSTSGLVETWKLGATSQVTDDIKVRGTWSLDIRAPLISELFSPPILAVAQLQYPQNTPSYQGFNGQGGNAALQPEKAVTLTAGIVVTPHWVPGLSLSLDWYNINIHGGIFTTAVQTVINRCLQGQAIYCSGLLFSPTANGGIQPFQVNTFPLNAAAIRTSGLDIQSNYGTDFFSGQLDLRFNANYTDELTQSAIGVTYDSAGALGGPLAYAASTEPKWHGILSATYSEGPWSATVQGRFFGAAVLTNGIQNLPANITRASLSSTGALTVGVGNGNLIDNNNVNPVGYLDLRLSYNWSDGVQTYAAVDNFTNVPRPADGADNVYDILGRVIRVGVRFSQ